MRPILLISSSLAAGILAGVAAHWGDLTSEGQAPSSSYRESDDDERAEAGNAFRSHPDAPADAPLRGASEDAAFRSLSPEQQRDSIVRISARLVKGGNCSDQLLLARAMGDLSYERATALLETMIKTEGVKFDPADVARGALAERMASLDPKRTLELGKTSEDPKITQAAILAIAQKSGAEALRALAQLPDKFRGSVAGEMRGNLNDNIGKAAGSLPEIAAALKENPQLLNTKSESEGAVRRLVGQVASQAAMTDPAKAMADLRQMAASLVQVNPGEDRKAAESAMVARIASQMTRTLRADSPASARVVFNSLGDSEKNGTMVALEASARFRETGADPAIQFAEKQTSPQFAKDAARGVWWSLAQQDRGSALQWIESLPAGPFRDGALNSVMQEASFRTRSWGETEEVVKAGTELRSTRTKLDYFTSLAQQRRADGSTQSEFVGKLAIPEAEKMELRRRLAPIPLR